MSCVVAVEDRGRVVMGGDARASDGDTGRSISEPKIWRAGAYLVGSGEAPALGALHASASLPARRRVQLGLEAAEAYACGVRRPFAIIGGAR
jgi:hypothetical protein